MFRPKEGSCINTVEMLSSFLVFPRSLQLVSVSYSLVFRQINKFHKLVNATFTFQIAGVILNGIVSEGDIEKSREKLKNCPDESFKKIFKLLYDANQQKDLFAYFKVDKIFDSRILSVDSKYRGKGIAKELMKRTEDLARDHGFSVSTNYSIQLLATALANAGFVFFADNKRRCHWYFFSKDIARFRI